MLHKVPNILVNDDAKGKPIEMWGRKAMGLKGAWIKIRIVRLADDYVPYCSHRILMVARLPYSTWDSSSQGTLFTDQEANYMKISNEEVTRLLSAPTQDRSATATSHVSSPARETLNRSAASVDVSGAAQEIQRVKKLINQLPDVRADRVQALKAQVDNGTYHVSGEDIADLIIRRALADNTAL